METRISFLRTKGTWREVADAARTTIRQSEGEGEPSSRWKKRILLAEHSPIRKLCFNLKWENLPYWVSVHIVRHKYASPAGASAGRRAPRRGLRGSSWLTNSPRRSPSSPNAACRSASIAGSAPNSSPAASSAPRHTKRPSRNIARFLPPRRSNARPYRRTRMRDGARRDLSVGAYMASTLGPGRAKSPADTTRTG